MCIPLASRVNLITLNEGGDKVKNIKIKAFTGYSTTGLKNSVELKEAEETINEFIKGKDVIDIKFSSTKFTYDFLVIYKVNE